MHTILAILLSAALAGGLDLLATSTLMHNQGVPVRRVLQFIASGAQGPGAFQRNSSASLGLALHFMIALCAAITYFVLIRLLPNATKHAFLAGAAFGVAVHLFMSQVVLPLSRTPTRPFALATFLAQTVIHIFCVGVPIALTLTRMLRP